MAFLKRSSGPLVYRQAFSTRLTHWIWVVCLFFLLLSGLQIFQARPDLYIGQQSGFQFDNAILSIGTFFDGPSMRGFTELFGYRFDTTGWLGAIWVDGNLQGKAFPGWLTIPSYRDLGSGRIVHFFFAWILVTTLLVWLISSLFNRHLSQDLVPTGRDLKSIGQDIKDHARLRLHNGRNYGVLQKLSYLGVMLVLLPLMVLSGLTMSPGMNAWAPWIVDLFGGRQTARTVHFVVMLLLVAFFVVHLAMVVLAGPFNELRSMITGWFRIDAEEGREMKIDRRRFLTGAAVTASTLPLTGCFDAVGDRNGQLRDFLEGANRLTYRVQRFMLGSNHLAREFSAGEIRQPMRPNGSTNPQAPEYLQQVSANFAAYRLAIDGMVERPMSFSLDELRNMPSRTQITRHDCVEGWSCIAEWTGVPLATVLDQAGVQSQARYAVFSCFDTMGNGFAGPIHYYESIDLIDARHPQTILAYGMNGETLPVSNGAPLRVRVERQLGYKMAKYISGITLTDDYTSFGQGGGGYWEDNGYEWFAGI